MGAADSVFHDLANQDPTALARLVLRDPTVEAEGLPASLPIVRRRDGDALFLARREGREFLLHVECELRDGTAEWRMLEYAGILAKREHRQAHQAGRRMRPIVSALLRLRGPGHPPRRAVLESEGIDEPTIVFRYLEVDVRGLEAVDLLTMGHAAVLPFVPLARGGEDDEILDRTAAAILDAPVSAEQRVSLLTSTWTLASVVGSHRMIARLYNMKGFEDLPNVRALIDKGEANALTRVLQTRLAQLGRPSPALLRKVSAIKAPKELEGLVAMAMESDSLAAFRARAFPR